MSGIWIDAQKFETDRGVWTVVRVEGRTFDAKDKVKAAGEFRYGYPFDLFVGGKAKTGLEGKDLNEWLDRVIGRQSKRWSLHWSGAPHENVMKLRQTAEALGCAYRMSPEENRLAEEAAARHAEEEAKTDDFDFPF